MSPDEVLFDAEKPWRRRSAFFATNCAAFVTGRATPALVENIRVKYYGSRRRSNKSPRSARLIRSKS